MTVSAALKAHLALDTTTMTTLWKITRKDATVFTFTEFNTPIVYGGLTYEPSTGFTHSAIATTAALNVDNLEVDSVLDSDTITDADLLTGIWDGAAVEIFQVNWADLSMGTLPLRSGTLGEVRTGRHSFNAELRGLTQPLQQTIGRLYSIACDADFGDARCGISPKVGHYTGAVASVVDGKTFTTSDPAIQAQLSDYFAYGVVEFTSGANNGLRFEVRHSTITTGQIVLQLPTTYPVTVGDTFAITAGCDKSIETCQAKFHNVVNFRGFPHIPGLDKLASGK